MIVEDEQRKNDLMIFIQLLKSKDNQGIYIPNAMLLMAEEMLLMKFEIETLKLHSKNLYNYIERLESK